MSMAVVGGTQGHVVAEVKMRRTLHAGSFLVLEGSDDLRFWRTRCHDSCSLIDGNGKKNVVIGLRRLDEIRFVGALGVVDSNHDHLAGKALPSTNLVATDAHDLECLLCRSPALDAVLAEFDDQEKISRFAHEHGMDVRAALLDRGLVFGRLRWAALELERGIGLPDIRRFVEEKAWAVDEDELIYVTAKSNEGVDANMIRHRIDALPPADPWHVVRGHDLLELLKIGLRTALGDLPSTKGVKDIAQALRLAMRSEDLRNTGLWRDMRQWEHLNEPFLVLAADSPD